MIHTYDTTYTIRYPLKNIAGWKESLESAKRFSLHNSVPSSCFLLLDWSLSPLVCRYAINRFTVSRMPEIIGISFNFRESFRTAVNLAATCAAAAPPCSACLWLPLFLELSGGGGASRPRKVVHYLQLCHRDYLAPWTPSLISSPILRCRETMLPVPIRFLINFNLAPPNFPFSNVI